MIKAVITDDSKHARGAIRAYIEKYCTQVKIIAEAYNIVSAAKAIQKYEPGLIFLDIDLNDGSGFNLLEIIKDKCFNLIITTPSRAHALRAFKYSAIDYLLKPIDTDELAAAVEKAAKQTYTPIENINVLMENSRKNTKPINKLELNTSEKIYTVNIDDIIRCEADFNYTALYFIYKIKRLVTKTLKELVTLLSEKKFMHLHQSHLLNLAYVKANRGYPVLKHGTTIPVSNRKKISVIEAINTL